VNVAVDVDANLRTFNVDANLRTFNVDAELGPVDADVNCRTDLVEAFDEGRGSGRQVSVSSLVSMS
jgi:hypothetical protein